MKRIAKAVACTVLLIAGLNAAPEAVSAESEPGENPNSMVAPDPEGQAQAQRAQVVESGDPACDTRNGEKPKPGSRCMTIVVVDGEGSSPPSDGAESVRLSSSGVEIPPWCTEPTTHGTRTHACRNYAFYIRTIQYNSNGAATETGRLYMNRWEHTYGSPSVDTFAHQSGISSYDGWGDALNMSVSGSASYTAGGDCTLASSSFPTQPIMPHHQLRKGEAFYDTTATAIGDVGTCTTTWELTFSVPTYNSAIISESMDDIRCDNAIGANGVRPRRVGCVVPWYASAVAYSQNTNPTLANHVTLAQLSGLPGATFAAPLNRETDSATIALNRSLACGDAPSVPEMSCDEYPLASSEQGLSSGGTRRSFPGCLILSPPATGPTGVSACMITASDNNAQGGLMSAFYYDERVLDGDPYRVVVVS
jgi:hypothetical protein